MPDLDRLSALTHTGLLDSLPEERFDRLTRLAANSLGTDIALVSLLDADRQWFKSRQGIDVSETPIDQAFCKHAIKSSDVMVVPDAAADPIFKDNPLVTGNPNVAFYAGAPLITKDGFALGTLCVIDTKPRHDFSEADKQILADIAASVMTEIEAGASAKIIDDLNVVNEELQHRMGNMYAHVSSLISMMSRSTDNQVDFVKRLRERITVLAQTQALIASHKYVSAPLSSIFESTLAPFLTDQMRPRVHFSNPEDFDVSPRGAFTLTLMLNELATNALKHGALKDENGEVNFSWLRDSNDQIKFEWKETSESTSYEPSEHKGFGSQILARIVPMDFQGDAEHKILPEGLLYQVSAKADRIGLETQTQ